MTTPRTIHEDIWDLYPGNLTRGNVSIFKDRIDTPCLRGQHELRLEIGGEAWMNNNISDDDTRATLISNAAGDILIGGLGLGGDVLLLKDLVQINSITVLENSAAVNFLVAPLVANPKTTILVQDAATFLAATLLRFDYVWLDLWQRPAMEIHVETDAMRLAATAVLRPGGQVAVWDRPDRTPG